VSTCSACRYRQHNDGVPALGGPYYCTVVLLYAACTYLLRYADTTTVATETHGPLARLPPILTFQTGSIHGRTRTPAALSGPLFCRDPRDRYVYRYLSQTHTHRWPRVIRHTLTHTHTLTGLPLKGMPCPHMLLLHYFRANTVITANDSAKCTLCFVAPQPAMA